jgi:hypothetical protein
MKPGEIIYIQGHTFRFETEQDDGRILFLRVDTDEAMRFVEQAKRERRWLKMGGEYVSTEARVIALKEANSGGLRVKLELRMSAEAAWMGLKRTG